MNDKKNRQHNKHLSIELLFCFQRTLYILGKIESEIVLSVYCVSKPVYIKNNSILLKFSPELSSQQ